MEHIPKHKLKNGVTYLGTCRNASEATWRAERNCFEYTRVKFGMAFLEDIPAPEDEKRYDVFYALEEKPNA